MKGKARVPTLYVLFLSINLRLTAYFEIFVSNAVKFVLVKEFHVNLYYLLFGEGEMFRSPLESVGSWGGKFSINSPDLQEFLEKFERSPYVQYNVLANFRILNFRDHEIIAQDIARADADRKSLKEPPAGRLIINYCLWQTGLLL